MFTEPMRRYDFVAAATRSEGAHPHFNPVGLPRRLGIPFRHPDVSRERPGGGLGIVTQRAYGERPGPVTHTPQGDVRSERGVGDGNPLCPKSMTSSGGEAGGAAVHVVDRDPHDLWAFLRRDDGDRTECKRARRRSGRRRGLGDRLRDTFGERVFNVPNEGDGDVQALWSHPSHHSTAIHLRQDPVQDARSTKDIGGQRQRDKQAIGHSTTIPRIQLPPIAAERPSFSPLLSLGRGVGGVGPSPLEALH